jgi:penicillin amidase
MNNSPHGRLESPTPRSRRSSRIRRWVLRVFFAGTACVALGAGVFAWVVLSSLPPKNRTLVASGLNGDVEILRDEFGVPHIFADTLDDATFALGYLHAEDRLWQMDIRRRVVRGQLSEVLGASRLGVDKRMRTLGLAELVESEYAALPDDSRRAVDAYAAGINAWLASNDSLLPPEFLVLGYEPEPWQPADGLLWTKLIALRLSGNHREEWLRWRLAKNLPIEVIQQLSPSSETKSATIGKQSKLPHVPTPSSFDPQQAHPMLQGERGASNAWVVSGARTETGLPLLANDPHLSLTTPAVWYLVHIETPDHTMIGASTPGFPFVVIGQNRHLAWGITNTGSDLEDLFLERKVPDDPTRYLVADGSEPFTIERMKIPVKGGSTVQHTVCSTRHGPVVYPKPDAQGGEEPEDCGSSRTVAALSATYLQPDDRTAEAAYRISQARTWEGFTEALKNFHAPQVNVLYADSEGNIGFIAPGRVPIRGGQSGWMPRNGWTADNDWKGWIPFEALPRHFNPATGYILNANESIAGPDYPYDLGSDWQPAFRAQRIDTLLGTTPKATAADMRAFQLDTISTMAQAVLPLLLAETPPTPQIAPILSALRAWNRDIAIEQPEPLLLASWLVEINKALFADKLGAEFKNYHGLRPLVVMNTLTQNREWCDGPDVPQTEDSCSYQLKTALEAALEKLRESHGKDWTKWRGGDVHVARFAHPFLARYPSAAKLLAPRRETAGGQFTVNRGGFRVNDTLAFDHVHGSGLRVVYDLADPRKSEFIIAVGQSGHPFSRHASDLIDAWRDGGGIRLLQDQEDLRAADHGRIVLQPR